MHDQSAILQKIKTLFREESFPAKTLLVTEGAEAKKLYFIDKGCARVWFNNDGDEVTFQFLFEGQFVSSFESLLSEKLSWYNVETIEPVTTYSITAAEFRQKMDTLPHVKEYYHHYVQERLAFYQQLFISHIKDSPEQRYKALLQKHPEIERRIPQRLIASYLGITSVSLSRIRNRK